MIKKLSNKNPTGFRGSIIIKALGILIPLGILVFSGLTYFGITPDYFGLKSTPPKTHTEQKSETYLVESEILKEGAAFTDPLTKATIGVSEVNYDKQISGNIKLPGQPNENFEKLMPGHTWTYEFEGKMYNLTYSLGDFMSDEFSIRIVEVGQNAVSYTHLTLPTTPYV